jgi:hypothetical protein
MGLEHRERQWWVGEIAKINEQLNQAGAARSEDSWY